MGIHAYLNDKGYMVNRQCSGVDLPPEKMVEVFDNNAPSRLPITDRGNYRG